MGTTPLLATTLAARRRRTPATRARGAARRRTTYAAILAVASTALIVAGLVAAAVSPGAGVQAGEFLAATAFTFVGTLLTLKRPGNTLSWLFAAVGFSMSYLAANNQMPDGFAGAQYFAWFGTWAFLLGVGSLATFLLLLFPDGSLPSRRWRPIAWASAAGLLLVGWSEALMPAAYTGSAGLPNPFAAPALKGLLDITFMVGTALILAGAFGGVAAVVVRFRRAAGVERQQVKWVLLAAAWGLCLWLAGDYANSTFGIAWDVIMAAVILPFPVAVGVAVLRYRLYEIDRVVSRTVSYALLTLVLAGIYLSVVTGMTALTLGSAADSPLAVAAATLLSAAAFGPARRRIQAAVDRRFNRAQYDAAATVGHFSVRLRDEVDIESLHHELVAIVSTTMQPTTTALWLKEAR